jgi:diguanylate cyclase (GGDEF)-like protein
VKPESSISLETRAQIRRLVWVSRAAGLAVGLALALGALYIYHRQLGSTESVYEFGTVVVGVTAFIVLSTLTRLAHAGMVERSLAQVSSLSEQLRDIADHDPLTGLFNLRAFQEQLAREIERARQMGGHVSLIIADLDNFKVLNDSFGHAFGDEVLRRTAGVFHSYAGGRAGAARLGGDEFALVLAGMDRQRAVSVARGIESELGEVRVDHRQTATLGSFGIGTFPDDGNTVQALFAAADGRMYSEKHHRKADQLSSLAGASRKLFVRVGAAMRPDRTTPEILQDVADATREQFALSLAAVRIESSEDHDAIAASSTIEAGLMGLSVGELDQASLGRLLPADAWIIEIPVADEAGRPGALTLAGRPGVATRPDTPVMLALADLVQAAVANGRAHFDAARAGRERDIHIELAHALSGEGTLHQRLSRVVNMVADFIGAVAVSIEGAAADITDPAAYNMLSGASPDTLERWEAARRSPTGRAILPELAAAAPFVFRDPAGDIRVPDSERELLRLAGIDACAIAAIRFDGQLLGILVAASRAGELEAARWLGQLTSIADHLAPVIKVALLHDELEASYSELERSSRESLARLADAAEARDPHTGGHLRRIRRYSEALALEMGLPPEEAATIAAASTVHDLGKLKLTDGVLMNPGRLDAGDWEQMMRHPADGERLIGASPMFEIERCVARWHHERWDGSGYPDGLVGEEIPLPARIVAVADAFDALTTVRPYKPAWPVERAFAEIVREAGSLYCPAVVEALCALHDRGALGQIVALVEADELAHEGAGEDPEQLAA